MSVSRETDERLAAYAALIRKWNPRINLVSPSTLADLEQRHLADCRQLFELARAGSGKWVDLGTGAGLPGMVLAILGQGTAAEWILVDSDARKGAFLRNAIRELALNRTQVITARLESLPPLAADGITARALAPLPRLVPYFQRHLRPGGVAWAMKGRNWQAELADVNAALDMTVEVHHSRTDDRAAILKLGRLTP